MRGLSQYLRRRGRDGAGVVGAVMVAGRIGQRQAGRAAERAGLEALAREVESVARYVSGLKREIGALRANEIYRENLPRAHGDLKTIQEATASSVNAIIEAGEAILSSDATTLQAYRAQTEEKIMAIFEACSFQDLTGQRVARVDEVIRLLERRLQRFALAVNAADGTGYDQDAIMREARREVLIVEGPQDGAAGCDQNAVDDLFN